VENGGTYWCLWLSEAPPAVSGCPPTTEVAEYIQAINYIGNP